MASSTLAGTIDVIHPQGHDLRVVWTTEAGHTLGERTRAPYLSNLGVDRRRHLREKHMAAMTETREAPLVRGPDPGRTFLIHLNTAR